MGGRHHRDLWPRPALLDLSVCAHTQTTTHQRMSSDNEDVSRYESEKSMYRGKAVKFHKCTASVSVLEISVCQGNQQPRATAI